MSFLQKQKVPLLSALFVFICGILLAGLAGLWGTPNPYNSYALQAARWLEGHLDLGQNYAHLEIAYFGGKYFISFPPFPSVLLLPLIPFFGTKTPDMLLSVLTAAIGAAFSAKLALSYGKTENEALFWSLFVTIGGNLLSVMCTGWVWFWAQTLAFTLLFAAIYSAKKGRTALALFFWAAAVGCRPFSAVCLPVILYLLHASGLRFSRKTFFRFVPAACLCLFYAALNFLRFGNPLEFGHNYLPEFLQEPQFGFSYVWENIKTLFRLPHIQNGALVFPQFNGFAFFLSSPFFLAYIVAFCRQKKDKTDILIACLLLLHLFLFCMHRTMGGWHFGHRYTIDLLPLCFLGTMRLRAAAGKSHLLLLLLGLMLHVYGFLLLFGAG